MVSVLEKTMDTDHTAFIKIKVKNIKKLVVKIHNGNYNSNGVYYDVFLSFPHH